MQPMNGPSSPRGPEASGQPVCLVCGSDQLQRQSARGKAWLHCWNCDGDGPVAAVDTEADGGALRPPGKSGASVNLSGEFVFDSPLALGYLLAAVEPLRDPRCLVGLEAAIRRRPTGSCSEAENAREQAQRLEAARDLRTELSVMFPLIGWKGDGEIQAFFIAPFVRDGGSADCVVGYHVSQGEEGPSFLAVPADLALRARRVRTLKDGRDRQTRARFIDQAANELRNVLVSGTMTVDNPLFLDILAFDVAVLDHCRGAVVFLKTDYSQAQMEEWKAKVRPFLEAACGGLAADDSGSVEFWRELIFSLSVQLRGFFRPNLD